MPATCLRAQAKELADTESAIIGLADCADSQLIGGIFHDGFVRLIDRHNEDGNCWPARLVIPTIVNTLVGTGSFNAGTETPWKALPTSQSQLGAVLDAAWTKYEQFYQDSGLLPSYMCVVSTATIATPLICCITCSYSHPSLLH